MAFERQIAAPRNLRLGGMAGEVRSVVRGAPAGGVVQPWPPAPIVIAVAPVVPSESGYAILPRASRICDTSLSWLQM